MKTVREVSRITGVSVRTLHHYDAIGLLKPTQVTEAGYRLYDTASLQRLHAILLLKELQFSLKDIKEILDSPNFERNKALDQQIELLKLKKEHPCGSVEWLVLRTGIDFRLRCMGCGHEVMIPREKLEKRIRRIVRDGIEINPNQKG